VYFIDAARVVTDSKLVVQLQKSDEDPVKYQYEERLTNPCQISTELTLSGVYGFNTLSQAAH